MCQIMFPHFLLNATCRHRLLSRVTLIHAGFTPLLSDLQVQVVRVRKAGKGIYKAAQHRWAGSFIASCSTCRKYKRIQYE